MLPGGHLKTTMMMERPVCKFVNIETVGTSVNFVAKGFVHSFGTTPGSRLYEYLFGT